MSVHSTIGFEISTIYGFKYEWVVMNSWRLQFGIDIYIIPSDNLDDFWCEQFILWGQKASTLFGI